MKLCISIGLLFLVTALWAGPEPQFRGKTLPLITVTAEGEGKTQEEAVQTALARCVERAVGVEGTSFLNDFVSRDEAGNTIRAGGREFIAVAHGLISEYEVIDRRWEGSLLVAKVTAKIIDTDKLGPKDQGFLVDVRIDPDKATYRHGEAITVQVTATRDCYFTILSHSADGLVYLVHPSEYYPNHLYEASGESLVLEAEAVLIDGMPAGSERLEVIASKVPLKIDDPVNWSSVPSVELGYQVGIGLIESRTTVVRWLSRLARDQWSLTVRTYNIVR